MSETNQFINGQWLAGEGAVFTSTNPADNEVLWQGGSASASQVDEAVKAARKALYTWSETSIEERIAICTKFTEIVSEHKEELATTIAQETGRLLWETRTEIGAIVGKLAISINAFNERTGTTENDMAGGKAILRHRAHGVMAVFGPYNFPAHLPNGHITPALIAGNTVVFKPSELTPKVAELTLKYWEMAGLPAGVINLVQGEIETGKALSAHKGIDGLLFTGSSTTGHILHQQFAGQPGKIMALEMGGNNPLVVHDISDIDGAVHDIIQSAFVTTGQRCTCARRLFLEAGEQGDAILARLIEVTKNIKCGNYDTDAFVSSLISEKAALGLMAHQQELIDLGAKVLVEMKHTQGTGFVTPAIVDVNGVDGIKDEEHFGPLLKVYRYSDLDDAIEQANDTAYGLSAGLLSDSDAAWEVFIKRIRAGIVNRNRAITGASSAAPFGGIGASGNHRAGAYYAADYCAFPIASMEFEKSVVPETLSPGLDFSKTA